MLKPKSTILLLISATTLPLPCFAQGMSEYGGLMGGQGKPGGGLGAALNGLYGAAAKVRGAGSVGVPTLPQIDPEDAKVYGQKANNAYTAGLAAEKAGKTADAIKQYELSLAIRQRTWGDKDPAVAAILQKQATLQMKSGNAIAAEAAYRKLVAIESKRFGSGDPRIAKNLSTLADLCDKNGHSKEAAYCYKQLLSIQLRDKNSDTAAIKDTRLKLANASTLQGDYTAAEQTYKEAISLEEASSAPDAAYLAKVCKGYGGLLRETNRDDEAVKMEARAGAAPVAATEPTPLNGQSDASAGSSAIK